MAKSDIFLSNDAIDVVATTVNYGTSRGSATIKVDPVQGNLSLGGEGVDGDLVLRDEHGVAKIHLSGGGGPAEAKATLRIDGPGGGLVLGGAGSEGSLTVRGSTDHEFIQISAAVAAGEPAGRIHLNGPAGRATLGGSGADGALHLRDKRGVRRVALGALGSASSDETTVAIDGLLGAITLGGKAIDGDLYVRNSDDKTTVHITGGADSITKPRPEASILIDGHTGTLRCTTLQVKIDGVVTDLVARIKALEAEIVALKKGRR